MRLIKTVLKNGLQDRGSKRFYIIFVVFLCSIICFAGPTMKSDMKILVDFSDEDEKDQWRIINDGVMGGLSQSRIDINTNAIAVFQGQLSLENNGGFASVRRLLRQDNLTGYTGVALRVKGDGRTYQFRVRTNERFDGIAYRAEFQTSAREWLTVKIPFKSFIPTFRGQRVPNVPKLRPGNIRQIGFLIADMREGVFRLEIDWISAYTK
jgi:NADH dehydrogenase [ubiquinone] 1 alpha subcomplex assembly factor 1